MTEQRNQYKGVSTRAWVRLRFVNVAGVAHELNLVADTGNPFAVILGLESMNRLKYSDAEPVDTNFGRLEGGWLRLFMPEFRADADILGYASDAVLAVSKRSSPDFEGLAGLPLLRLFEYGGDADTFWIKPLS